MNTEIFKANEQTVEEIRGKKKIAWCNPRFLPFDMEETICRCGNDSNPYMQ